MLIVSDSMNPPPSLTVHVYSELLILVMIMMSSTNSCTAVPLLTTVLDPFTHWMDCTGTGVEHVMLVVSPSWKSLFPVMLIAVAMS